eukprot:evm.model.NODE_5397_length_1496_cov_27.137701.1
MTREPKTAQAINESRATTMTKSACMTLAVVKEGAITFVSGVARHCWGSWGLARCPISAHVVYGQACNPSVWKMSASTTVLNHEETSTAVAAAAAAAAATAPPAPPAPAPVAGPASTACGKPKAGRATNNSKRSMSDHCRLETASAPTTSRPTFDCMASVVIQ